MVASFDNTARTLGEGETDWSAASAISNYKSAPNYQSQELSYSVLIMSRNEADNLRLLLPHLHEILGGTGVSYEIIVVDGQSRDNTEEVARGLGATVYQQSGPGYGSAFREGLSYCRGNWIITVDADHSHPPQFLRAMISNCNGADVVIASRYVPGAAAHMELYRFYLSRVLSGIFRIVLGVPVKDLSSGFRMYRRAIFKDVKLEGRDFDVLIEVLLRVLSKGYKVREVPFIYEPRVFGRSNARLARFAVSYLATLKRMWILKNSFSAADYDERAYNSIIPMQRFWQRKRTSHVLALADRHIKTLDIGSGSNRACRSFPSLIAVDLNLNPLRFLQARGVLVTCGDALALPFSANTFGQIIFSQVIQEIDASRFTLKEIVRVLQPNGVLVFGFCDFSNWLWRIIHFCYSRLLPNAYGQRAIVRNTKPQILAWLKESGFNVEASKSILGCEILYRAKLVNKS